MLISKILLIAFNAHQLLITHYRGSKSSTQMSGFLKVMLHQIHWSPVQVFLSIKRDIYLTYQLFYKWFAWNLGRNSFCLHCLKHGSWTELWGLLCELLLGEKLTELIMIDPQWHVELKINSDGSSGIVYSYTV